MSCNHIFHSGNKTVIFDPVTLMFLGIMILGHSWCHS
jgi:hypothetical protein